MSKATSRDGQRPRRRRLRMLYSGSQAPHKRRARPSSPRRHGKGLRTPAMHRHAKTYHRVTSRHHPILTRPFTIPPTASVMASLYVSLPGRAPRLSQPSRASPPPKPSSLIIAAAMARRTTSHNSRPSRRARSRRPHGETRNEREADGVCVFLFCDREQPLLNVPVAAARETPILFVCVFCESEILMQACDADAGCVCRCGGERKSLCVTRHNYGAMKIN